MPSQKVVFIFRNKRYERKFDREQLSLGKSFWVTTNEDDMVIDLSADKQPNGIATQVTWIAPSEWAVWLDEGNDLLPNLEQKLGDIVGSLVPMSDIASVIQSQRKMLKRTDFVSDFSLTSEFINSPLHVMKTVIDRIDLCDHFGKLDVQESLFHHHEPLLIYLYLTCFDRLGQRAAYITFGDWLITQKKQYREQRENVKIPHEKSPTEITKLYYDKYIEEFGVKTSFYRFLHSVLPNVSRVNLLASFEIMCLENPPSLKDLSSADDKAKEAFLFKLRNDYTHNGNFKGGIGSHMPTAPNPGHWRAYYQEFRKNDWRTVEVWNWPNIFRECVKHGLASYIRTLSTEEGTSA